MLVQIEQHGEALTLTIPASLADASQLAPGSFVDLSLLGGKIILAPLSQTSPTLEELVAGITPENRHEETETGSAVGREEW